MTIKENPDIQEKMADGQEHDTNEDISGSNTSDENSTDEKVSNEKVSNEKVSNEKDPDETTTDKKTTDENDSEAESSEENGSDDKSDRDKSGEDDSNNDQNESSEEDEDLKTKHLRLMADFQNYKRRAEEARMKSYSNGREDMITDILPVIDNFERALETEDEKNDGFKEGMAMIFKQMMDVLTKAGLEEIKAQGEEFDPNYHNAVMTEDTDEFESNHVTEVLQKGYMFKEKVIRPSMVKVAN